MRRSITVVLTMMFAVSMIAGCTSYGDNPARMTDADIKASVEQKFTEWSEYDWSPVYVTVSNGVVTLRGTVDTTAQRQTAESAAHSVKDVARIVNEINVR